MKKSTHVDVYLAVEAQVTYFSTLNKFLADDLDNTRDLLLVKEWSWDWRLGMLQLKWLEGINGLLFVIETDSVESTTGLIFWLS